MENVHLIIDRNFVTRKVIEYEKYLGPNSQSAIARLTSISSTFYVQIFRMNIVLAAFSMYM